MPRASGRSCYWTHAMCVSIQERTYAPPTIVAPHRTRSRVLRPGAGAGGANGQNGHGAQAEGGADVSLKVV